MVVERQCVRSRLIVRLPLRESYGCMSPVISFFELPSVLRAIFIACRYMLWIEELVVARVQCLSYGNMPTLWATLIAYVACAPGGCCPKPWVVNKWSSLCRLGHVNSDLDCRAAHEYSNEVDQGQFGFLCGQSWSWGYIAPSYIIDALCLCFGGWVDYTLRINSSPQRSRLVSSDVLRCVIITEYIRKRISLLCNAESNQRMHLPFDRR